MGATKGWRGGDPNRSPYGPVREVGPSPRSCGRRDPATAAEEVANCSQPAGARGNLARVSGGKLAAGNCIEDWEGRRPKPAKLALHSKLRAEVMTGLELDWSPQQISRSLKEEYPEEPSMQVSH